MAALDHQGSQFDHLLGLRFWEEERIAGAVYHDIKGSPIRFTQELQQFAHPTITALDTTDVAAEALITMAVDSWAFFRIKSDLPSKKSMMESSPSSDT
uniref:Uncharacterized protein n=1 Tax=Sphaerodactylus townsendi TaxID=933632 RepID=A0ACB8ES99_9SAUR